jgi:hypothetical protein
MSMTAWQEMMSKPDFKLRVEACRLGLSFEVAFAAPADFILAWIAATK